MQASGETQYQRKRREAEFFDRQASARSGRVDPISPDVVARYRAASRSSRFSLEYAVALTQPIAGKRVLVAGCGEGNNAVLFATLGATVEAIDISPGAIAVGQEHAQRSGVADRISWTAGALEDLDLAALGNFDIVWCDAILHHLIADFDQVVQRLWACVRPGGQAIVIEPYSLSPTWRLVRRALLPRNRNVTPDERPLNARELTFLTDLLQPVSTRYFRGFARLTESVLGGKRLEDASAWRRGVVRCLAELDGVVLSTPLGARVGSRFVMAAVRPPGPI